MISRSTGPSGANAEYLFMLEDALMNLGDASGDEHIKDLAGRVRSLMKDGNGNGARVGNGDDDGVGRANDDEDGVKMQTVEHEAERVRSGKGGQAGEETEKVSQL